MCVCLAGTADIKCHGECLPILVRGICTDVRMSSYTINDKENKKIILTFIKGCKIYVDDIKGEKF